MVLRPALLTSIGAVLALAALGACATGGAPSGVDAEAEAGEEAPVSLFAMPESLVPEQLAARRCEKLASYEFPSGVLPLERRGPEGYEIMLKRDQERVWKRWLHGSEASGRTTENDPVPNAVLFLGVPSYEEFLEDGRWHGRAVLMVCGQRAVGAEGDLSDEFSGSGTPYLQQLDPDLAGDRAVTPPPFALFTHLDAPQRRVSAALTRISVDADELLVDERAYYAASGTVLRLALDTVFQEGGGVGFFADVRLKLHLPNTEERLFFLFESDPDEFLLDKNATTSATPGQALSDRAYFAGLQFRYDLGAWRIRPSIGLKLGSPVDGYGRLRVDRTIRVGAWLLRPSETVFWYYSTGWGESTNLVADYLLREDLLFRSDSTAQWTRERSLFELSQVLLLVHTLDPLSTMTYLTGVLGESEPALFSVEYVVAVSYRRLIHGDYVYLDLIPQTTFRRVNDFEDEHSFTLRLEVYFKG